MRKPSPRSPSVFATGTRTPVYRTSQCVFQPRPACPITEIGRTISTPGVSAGTMICVPRSCGSASGSVTAIDDPERRPLGARREPLVPVDHPLVAVHAPPASAAASDRSPRPRARSSRRTTAPRPATSGSRNASFCSVGAEHGAGSRRCRRRAPGSRTRAAPRASGRSPRSGRRSTRKPLPGAACLRRHVRSPEPRLARLRLELLRRARSAASSSRSSAALVREDVLLHERPVPRARRLEVRGGKRAVAHTAVGSLHVRLGSALGYDDPARAASRSRRRRSRLGFHSVWTSEAYGTDAVTPMAWIARDDRAHRRRQRDHADAGAVSGERRR